MSDSTKSVLIVEDDLNLRDILKKMCEKAGWTVYEAGDGQDGYEQAKTHKPAVVLLDLLMPVLDGFGFLKLLRGDEDKEVKEISVVVLSNLYTNEDILRAEGLGIEAYFVKTNTTLEEVISKTKEIISK